MFNRTTGGQQGYSLPALSDSSEKGRRSSPAHEGGRLRHLEGRVNLGEQSNKALLEELVRLQGDLKGSIRRNQDILREEREERLILAEKIQAANNLYTQMMMRMARAEEKIETEHNTVGSLVNHTKQVEQALIGNQQQLLSRREQITVHVERLRDDIEDMRENCEQLQKNMRALTDDVRTMKSKHEVQVVQFGTVVQEIRQRVKKIEGDTSAAVSTDGTWKSYNMTWIEKEFQKSLSQIIISGNPFLPPIKDGANYCYCAYVLRIFSYSDFLSPMLTNTGIFLRGLKLSGESRS